MQGSRSVPKYVPLRGMTPVRLSVSVISRIVAPRARRFGSGVGREEMQMMAEYVGHQVEEEFAISRFGQPQT